MTYFEKRNKENEMWGLIAEQILLGKLNPATYTRFSGDKIKPKISAILIDKSSTGKDVTIDALNTAAKAFGLKTDKIMDIQEAGLTGTIVKKEKVFGKLYDHDILTFPECSNLFTNSEHKTTLITALQGAIEDNGFVNKRVAGQDIKYNTNVSILMASIPVKKLSEAILDKGIFQRCMLSCMNRDIDEIYNTTLKIRASKIRDYTKELEDYKDNIHAAMRCMPETVKLNEELTEITHYELIDFFKQQYETIFDEFKQNTFIGFQRRAELNLDSMAINIMFRDMKPELDLDCYKIPMQICKHHFESVVAMLNGSYIKKKYKPGIANKKKYDKDKVLKTISIHKGNQTELYHEIGKLCNVSVPTAIKIYREVVGKQ